MDVNKKYELLILDYKSMIEEVLEEIENEKKIRKNYLNKIECAISRLRNERVYNETNPVAKWISYKKLYYVDQINFDLDCIQKIKDKLCQILNCNDGVGCCFEEDNISRYLKVCDGEDRYILETDTMNSFWGIYKNLMNIYYPEDKISLGDLEKLYGCVINRKYSDVNEMTLLKDFAQLSGTIGNYIVVPKGYNRTRSRKTNDLWDLSLQNLMSIDTGKRDASYGWYINHIDLFLLTDWFEGTKVNIIGGSHGTKLNEEQIILYLKCINSRIVKRSARMIMLLQPELKEDYFLKNILEFNENEYTSLREMLEICQIIS